MRRYTGPKTMGETGCSQPENDLPDDAHRRREDPDSLPGGIALVKNLLRQMQRRIGGG